MWNIEALTEIFETMRKNKLRTILTGISVALGIFIFVVLMGLGEGFKNGMQRNFEGDAVNLISVNGGQTSEEYRGYKKGRQIELTSEDSELLTNYFDEVENTGDFFYLRDKKVSYKDKFNSYRITGLTQAGIETEGIEVKKGRSLNDVDLRHQRKVVLLGETVYEELFKEGEDPLGSYINVENTLFLVVGVVSDHDRWKNNRLFIPLTTARSIYNGSNRLHSIDVALANVSVGRSVELESEIRNLLGRKHLFAGSDKKALWIRNNMEGYKQAMGVITGMTFFLGLVGLLTLLSGITGVVNIMFIIVKERTKEIGIKKALGAKPNSIIKQLVVEAVLITAVSGYVGLMLGVLLVDGVGSLMKGSSSDFFADPSIKLSTALFATVVLIVSGAIAGLIPARKAAKIKPIEALRYE